MSLPDIVQQASPDVVQQASPDVVQQASPDVVQQASPDVVIIGAGIIGCATAFELSKKGYKTLNIDKLDQAGSGSTSNSCAVVRASYSTFDGITMAHECFQYWKDWENYLGVKDERGYARFVNDGTVMMRSPDARYERMIGLFDQVGIGYELWTADEVRNKLPFLSAKSHYPPLRIDDPAFWDEPTKDIVGGLYIHDGGYVTDPQLATHNLMVAAQAHGAQFIFGTAVSDIRQAAGRVQGVTLENGREIDAPIVINIAGPHSFIINRLAGVEDDMNIKTRPLRHEVHFVPNPPDLQIGDYFSHYSDDDAGVYFRPETGNAILVGSKDPACDEREWIEDPDDYNREVSVDQWKNQVYRFSKRLPALRIPNQPRGIVDLYDVADDWIPIYDKSSLSGFYMAVGTSGNQFKTAPPVGYMLTQLVDAVENGYDHDADPLKYTAVYTQRTIDVGFYSRLREINQESSFTVNG